MEPVTKKRKNKSKSKQIVQDVCTDSETSDENKKKENDYNHDNERLLNGGKIDLDRSVPVEENKRLFRVNFEIDLVSVVLLFCGVITRMYRLEEPQHIV